MRRQDGNTDRTKCCLNDCEIRFYCIIFGWIENNPCTGWIELDCKNLVLQINRNTQTDVGRLRVGQNILMRWKISDLLNNTIIRIFI